MTEGLYWHVHHETLYEWCWDAEGRREYIRTEKPEEEREIRLRLMKPIQGTLGVAKALDEYARAWAAYVRAECDKARAECDKARAAWQASIKPGDAEALHAKECKNCPWNGKTIFPEKP